MRHWGRTQRQLDAAVARLEAAPVYAVWFHGQGRRPRRPRLLYSGSDARVAHGTFGSARLQMERGRLILVHHGHEVSATRRGAR